MRPQAAPADFFQIRSPKSHWEGGGGETTEEFDFEKQIISWLIMDFNNSTPCINVALEMIILIVDLQGRNCLMQKW